MTLYEIDEQILECIDEETGEIIDVEKLTALNMEREKKISNVACWIKDLKAEAEAIKNEKQNLAKRQATCENKAESLKKWLAYALNGEKFKDSKCNIGYRKSTSVNFGINFDFNTLPEDLKKVTVEPKKNDIKQAIKDGLQIEGVTLEESNNIIVQ